MCRVGGSGGGREGGGGGGGGGVSHLRPYPKRLSSYHGLFHVKNSVI